MQKKRYVQVGVGSRSGMYTRAITQTYPQQCELAAICDTNPVRMDFCLRRFCQDQPNPPALYPAEQFDRMLADTRPDIVIVTSVDATHADYICRALEAGCDVISEKPMTTDAPSARRVLQTIKKTGRKVTVGFNVRYLQEHEQLKEILAAGKIGELFNVSLTWKLDIRHGADYFRRWHRQRRNSGSLLIHKATHHFDLVNWFINDVPEEVFAHGSLRFYTPEMADQLGLQGRAERCLDCPLKTSCHFYYDLNLNEGLKEMYLKAEKADGYFRDRCVFAAEIDIWDSMSLTVKYRGGAILSYLLHAFSPYEGFHLALNGSQGRLEYLRGESDVALGITPGDVSKSLMSATLYPIFGEPQPIELRSAEGGHGGADPRLAEDLFGPEPQPDPLGKRADALTGAYAVMIGAAAAESIDTGRPIQIRIDE